MSNERTQERTDGDTVTVDAQGPVGTTVESPETVACDGPYCDGTYYIGRTVDVVVGTTIGEFVEPEPHVGVAGLPEQYPERQKWCRTCAREAFGVDYVAGERSIRVSRSLITPKTVLAFGLGVGLALLLASFFIV